MDAAPRLAGRTVAVTAERRSTEQVDLLENRGATVVHVPTLHTVDLRDDAGLRARTAEVIAEPPEWTVATTGFGMKLWFEAADAWGLGEALVDAIGRSKVVARGPKARSACRARGLDVMWQAPEESMAAVVQWLGAQEDVVGARLVLQLFDAGDQPALAAVAALTGKVVEVPLYRWQRPDDEASVLDLVRRIIVGEIDAVTFTSQPALRFLVDIAAGAGLADELVAACNDGRTLPVCIGPVCAEAAVDAGITTSIWPEPWRLVPMVKLVEARLGR